MQYRINNPGVIQETLEGEAVIVNLLTGSYYSLDQAGGVIWSLLIGGVDSADIPARLSCVFDAEHAVLAAAVNELVAALVQEELIVPLKAAVEVRDVVLPEGARARFEQPVLHRYTDMQELLLLDPIHDVSERGWPHTNTDERGAQ